MKDRIRQRAIELGFDDCRFTHAAAPDHAEAFRQWIARGQHGEMNWLERNAARRVDPHQVLSGARSIISLAVAYPGPESIEPDSGEPCGIIARYARFADYHEVLAQRLRSLTECVSEMGGPTVRSLWYVDTGPVLERDYAQRAGLGFVGKHTNLISRKLGNWIFLSEILTTLDLPPDEPEKNRCGHCTRCIDVCPTAAITAPFHLDARRCISYLTIELKGSIPVELRPLVGNRIFGCDDCLAACPWNRFARAGSMMQAHARVDLGTPGLIGLLGLDDAAFRARFAGTPMLRTKRRGLLRNVCVALGNVGDDGAVPALERALHDPEPLVREHAAWALERIGQTRSGEAPQEQSHRLKPAS